MVNDVYDATIVSLRRKYGPPIGEGFYRVVFAMNAAYVLKAPRDAWGDYCNHGEARDAKTDMRFARCNLVRHWRGLWLLRMERIVRFPTARSRLPSWTDCIDCQQVGWTRDGRLVAYDFVYPPR